MVECVSSHWALMLVHASVANIEILQTDSHPNKSHMLSKKQLTVRFNDLVIYWVGASIRPLLIWLVYIIGLTHALLPQLISPS